MNTPDKYDEAIEFLTQNPDHITWCWTHPSREKHGCLFAMLQGGSVWNAKLYSECGCPSLIKLRTHYYTAFHDDAFTEWVREQPIPGNPEEIKPEHLPVFAAIQRRADREFRNKK